MPVESQSGTNDGTLGFCDMKLRSNSPETVDPPAVVAADYTVDSASGAGWGTDVGSGAG